MLKKISRNCPPTYNDAVFCQPEVLLLESLRLWSQSPGTYRYIQNRMVEALGQSAGVRSAKAVKMLGHILGLHARRTFLMMMPGTRGATSDERALIAVLGALLHGRRAQATAIAIWLLPYNCHGTFLAVAGELARAMASGGLVVAPPRVSLKQSKSVVQVRDVA